MNFLDFIIDNSLFINKNDLPSPYQKEIDKYNNRAPPDVLSKLKTDKNYTRGLILFEVLNKTEIFEAYRKFCRALGRDFVDNKTDKELMQFPEYEYWFLKFQRNDFNMETPDFNSLTSLSNMPEKVLLEIVKNLSYFELQILRQVNRPLQYLIDNAEIQLDFLAVRIDYNSFVEYYDSAKNVWDRKESDVEVIINDLEVLFRNPKIKLISFNFQSHHRKKTKFLEPIFKSLENQINSTHFDLSGSYLNNSKTIFKSLKPGVLETIGVNHWRTVHRNTKLFRARKWAELEQWKQAKVLNIPDQLASVPIESLRNFEKFRIFVINISGKEIAELRNMLFNSDHFQHGVIKTARPLHLKSILKWLGLDNVGQNFPLLLVSETEKSMGKLQIEFNINGIVIGWTN